MADREHEVSAVLRRAALFRTLSPALIAHVAASAKVLKVARGEQICRCGERCSGFYMAISGRVMLRVGASNEPDKVIELVSAGGYIGLAAAVLDTPEALTAETLIDSVLLLIPRAALLDAISENHEFALRLIAELSRQVCGLISDIEAFSLRSGRERVANYLLQVATAHGARQRPVALPAKKSIIASRLSLTPEHFSRTLHALIEAGAIAVNGRQITVLDPTRLRHVAR
jgi:CRP-like cAMP-binding protein